VAGFPATLPFFFKFKDYDSVCVSVMLQQIRENYNQLSTLHQRSIIALVMFFDSLFLGLSYGNYALALSETDGVQFGSSDDQ